MALFRKLIYFSTNHPKIIILLTFVAVIAFGLQFPKIIIDTDPENMLSDDEFARVYHNEIKNQFRLYDFIVLGIVNTESEEGVFNPDTLGKIVTLSEKIRNIEGVISYELISLSTKDNIRQGGPGVVTFEWLMKRAPKTREAALFIRDEAKDNPMLDGTIVSEDGKVACIYIPVKKKDVSYRVSREIENYLTTMKGPERYHLTGLPIAEDTFGVEMFKQMAISAPLAGLIIFIIMWFFFKKISLILSPMLVAVTSIICAMGLLIGRGFTVHIMSSMIPIFLMPIAVVDSVHILSEFFDKYPAMKDKKKTIHHVMEELFMPMLFTSLTSAAGFASLAFTPIPPVKIFGVFVAFGIILAWVLTITFIPAYVMLIKESSLMNYGKNASPHKAGFLDTALIRIGNFSEARWKAILGLTAVIIVVSLYGISKININDNPVKWFSKNHKIRVADRILNGHFGGTYTAYLVLDTKADAEAFKDPSNLRWVESLQNHLAQSGMVGKSTSLADVVKKIYYELLGGDRSNNKIPDSRNAVAQCLASFENSHKPDDLWHLVTPAYDKAIIWLQLKSGDNKDMIRVVHEVDAFMLDNPPPTELTIGWAGLTYINTIWQDKMVKGMLKSLLGAFVIVFIMMAVLFRSSLWGVLCMIPLSVTILFIYGIIGFIGKDYDMPAAVLSSLTLGLSVDFAIHFLQRARAIHKIGKSWGATKDALFGEPARAITKNAIVIAIGFSPLLVASLVPYKTVGVFLISIMVISCIATLFILTALISALKRALLKN